MGTEIIALTLLGEGIIFVGRDYLWGRITYVVVIVIVCQKCFCHNCSCNFVFVFSFPWSLACLMTLDGLGLGVGRRPPHAWERRHDPNVLHVTIQYQGVDCVSGRSIAPRILEVIVIAVSEK